MNKEKIFDNRTLPLESNQYYHIYNRGNNKTNIFYIAENYKYFLEKYAKYLSDYVDTYAYCLLPNHFHILIRVKSELDLQGLKDLVSLKGKKAKVLKSNFKKKLTDETQDKQSKPTIDKNEINIPTIISNQFRLLFMSYAKAINKQENITGSIFQKVFRRKRIDDINYLLTLVGYIHANAFHHKIYDSIEKYQYSSYSSLLSTKSTLLKREDVLEWFGGRAMFMESHKAIVDLDKNNKYWIEENI